MGLFGNDPQPNITTTTNILSPEQQKLISLGMPGIESFANKPLQQFQGQTYAGFDQSQTAGQEAALQAAGNQTQLAQAGGGTSNYWMSPDALDVSNNSAVQGAISSATRPIEEQLMRYGLPASRAGAESTGNFGSSKAGISDALTRQGAYNAMGDVSSKIALGAYNTNVEAQLKALGLLPQTIGSQTTGALTTSGVGDVRQGMSQQAIDEAMQRFNFDQNADYLRSKDILGISAGLPGGSTQTVGTAPQKNQLTSALGGAAAGASIGSVIPGIGMGIGAGIGGLIGFLG
jgi:hypothetical protein